MATSSVWYRVHSIILNKGLQYMIVYAYEDALNEDIIMVKSLVNS